jgi:hypothetical protein
VGNRFGSLKIWLGNLNFQNASNFTDTTKSNLKSDLLFIPENQRQSFPRKQRMEESLVDGDTIHNAKKLLISENLEVRIE